MIKNKNGSYNKFKLLIISLIIIITISITGVYILQNIELPKIETPSWATPVPTPTPTPIPIPIPTPTPTPTPWVYPSNINTSTPFTEPYAYGGGRTSGSYVNVSYGGGSGGTGSYTNVSYAIVVGGGGGGVGYTSVAYINSTPAPTTQPIISQEVFVNASQNVSQALVQIVNPLGESSWLLYLLIIIPMMMMVSMIRGNSLSMLLPAILGLVIFGYFFNIGSLPILVMLGIIPMILITSSMFSDR
jgi:hypothetical protein